MCGRGAAAAALVDGGLSLGSAFSHIQLFLCPLQIMPGLPARFALHSIDNTAPSGMNVAFARRTCTCLLPLRSFLLKQASTALHRDVTEAARCFGGRHQSWEQRQPITTCAAAKAAPTGTALASGDYGAEQIQVSPLMLHDRRPASCHPQLSRCLLKCSPDFHHPHKRCCISLLT